MIAGVGITIFSAPNYCDSVGNKGAYIHITPDRKLKFNQFDAVPVCVLILHVVFCTLRNSFTDASGLYSIHLCVLCNMRVCWGG